MDLVRTADPSPTPPGAGIAAPGRAEGWLLGGHALVLVYGGAYTYAETPLGFWLRDLLDLDRNPYDRIGHFVQGFVPVQLAREILLRRTPLRPVAGSATWA